MGRGAWDAALSSTIAELRLRQQDKEAQLEHLRRENAKLREEMGSLEHASRVPLLLALA